MGSALSLLLLGLPTLLVCAAFLLGRGRSTGWRVAIWLFIAVPWIVSGWLWWSYSLQQDDVGLMVYGIMAAAVSASALVATIAAVLLRWRGGSNES